MAKLQLVDLSLLNQVINEAKHSPRLRMNYNFHTDLNDKCQRLLNAMEPGTVMPIHHHKVDEMWMVLQGKLKVTIHNNHGDIIEEHVLSPNEGLYGVQIPANTWHSLEVIEPGTVIFEVKEGPYIPHEVSGILDINNS